jgi:DNA-binding MarR family transcriptional regulator
MHHQHAQESISYPAFLILASLLEEPKLVTALRQAIVQETGQVIEPAAFSRILARLERRGWIARLEGSEPVRLCHLTASGMLALQQAEEPYRRNQEEQEWNGWSPDLSGRKEIIMRLVLWILRLYPPAWRERYETEMAALLEQHHLTLWTVLDLLVGALDARLDPHYRRARQLLPLRGIRTSWQLAIAAFMAFWIALLPWLWLSVLGIDPDTQCENWGTGFALCNMRVTVGMHTASLAHTLIGNIIGWLPVLLIFFAGILVQSRVRKAGMNLLLAFLVAIGMLALCIACGVWLNGLRPLLPQISQFFPQATAGLLAGLLAMGLATVIALGALVRAMFALKKLSPSAPKQESHAFSSYTEESEPVPGADIPQLEHLTASAVGNKDSSVSKGWRVLLVAVLLLFLLPWPNLISSDGPDFLQLLITWGLAGIVGIITAWLVKSPRKKQSQSAAPQPRRGLPSLLRAVLLPLPFLIFTIWMVAPILINASPGLPVRPVSLIACLLIASLLSSITVMIVKIQNTNKQVARSTQRPENEVSPRIWIIILPVVFLVFCTEVEFIGLPDYNTFGDVLVFWCMAGLASLIILLTLKIGRRKSTNSLPEETLQQVQAQS